MVTKLEYENICVRVLGMLDAHGIVLNDGERGNIEVADFGLGEVERTGLQIVTYINTARVCAKELVMLPGQTCPEHLHPTLGEVLGKEETFRCRAGEVYIYVPGDKTVNPVCVPPDAPVGAYTAWHEIKLLPGEQYTLMPDTLHWFQAGAQGAIVSEFSTRSTDDADVFTDTRIVRAPVIM